MPFAGTWMRARVMSGIAFSLLAAASDLLAQPAIDDWARSQESFKAWQQEMIRRRGEPNEALRRTLARKIEVPSPSCDAASRDAYPYRVRLRPLFGSGILPVEPEVELGLGEPRAQVSVNVKGKALNFIAVTQKYALTYSASENEWAFLARRELGAGMPLFGEGPGKAGAEVVFGGFGVSALKVGGELSLGHAMLSGKAGLNDAGEVSLGAGAGVKAVPEPFGRLAQLSASVDGQVSVPVIVTDVQFGSRYGLNGALSSAAASLARLLAKAIDCPYCEARGQVTCRQCADRRVVTCPKCRGGLTETCSDCGGGGRLACPPTRRCGSCGGDGYLSCRTTVTVYDSVEESYDYFWVENLGFDDQNRPIKRTHRETRYRTVQKPRSVSCPDCNGTGQGPPCGRCDGGVLICAACQGSGSVSCGDCGGTGRIPCGRCSGKGSLTCPTCGGEEIVCRLCSGNRAIGETAAPPRREPRIRPDAVVNDRIAASFEAIRDYLPSGASLSSGVRTPERQVRVIEKLARAEGLLQDGEKLVLEEQETWLEIWRTLLEDRKIVVNPPVAAARRDGHIVAATPHARGDCFDLAGAPVDEIERAVRRAEADGRIRTAQVKVETHPRQQVVHVQLAP